MVVLFPMCEDLSKKRKSLNKPTVRLERKKGGERGRRSAVDGRGRRNRVDLQLQVENVLLLLRPTL